MNDTLAHALDATDMVVIDDLYAFEFALGDDGGLTIVCMDGRTARRWVFTPEQVAGATAAITEGEWKITGAEGEHRLRLLEAFSAEEDEDQA